MSSLLALLAALTYGASDFLGGLGGRRADPGVVSALAQAVAIAPAAIALALFDSPAPGAASVLWSAVAGAAGGLGTAALYRGLARGQMSVVAPVSAVTTAVLPAVVGLATGDALTALGWIGIVLAVPAIALVSAGRGTGHGVRTSVGWGLLAGAGFGVLFVGLDRAGTASGAWPVFLSQVVAAIAVVALAAPTLRRRRTGERDPVARGDVLRFAVPAGVLSSVANLLFLAATGSGELTVASVLTALYPATTVLLAALLLRDRPGRTQLVGLVAAAAAVTMVVVGE